LVQARLQREERPASLDAENLAEELESDGSLRRAGTEMGLRERECDRLVLKACEWTLDMTLNAGFWPPPVSTGTGN
jgi:hypothetical protein